MAEQFVIGLDFGTTSVKAVLFHLNGKVKAEAEAPNQTYYPESNWAEQDPVELEQSTIQALKNVIEKSDIDATSIVAIGISCAMHSLICVDDAFQPLSNAIIWSDGRASDIAERIKGELADDLYARTGVPNHPMSPLLKLMWMKENDIEAYKKASYFISVKEYILQKWYGKLVADYSMAAASGLMNAATLTWDEKALELAGIQESQLPTIVPPTETLSGLRADIAEEIGIDVDTPLVLGAADGQLANLGIGAIAPGEVALTVGTSGAIRQFTKGYNVNEKHETFSYAFSEEYNVIGGPTNNGGVVLQWLKDLLNDSSDFTDFINQAKDIAPVAEGIVFLPYINGERAPLWNQKSAGNFYGVSITHKQAHFVRAALEGITFNLYQIDEALTRLAGKSDTIYVNGGLARSPLWLQMLADIFNKKVYVAQTHHSSAWGAAWTALVAVGIADSYEQIKETVVLSEPVLPDTTMHEAYQQIYQQYKQLSEDIRKYFK